MSFTFSLFSPPSLGRELYHQSGCRGALSESSVRAAQSRSELPQQLDSYTCTLHCQGTHTADQPSPRRVTFTPCSARGCTHGPTLRSTRQPCQKRELLRHHYSRLPRESLCLPGSEDLGASKRKFLSSTHFAEWHKVRTRASQCKLESQNEALVPNTHSRSKDFGPCYRRAVLEVTGKEVSPFLHRLLCPTRDTNLGLQPMSTYQDPGPRNPGTRKRKACLDSPEQIHEAPLPGNG